MTGDARIATPPWGIDVACGSVARTGPTETVIMKTTHVFSERRAQSRAKLLSPIGPLGLLAAIFFFALIGRAGNPEISGFSPASGAIGSTLTINGSAFTGATAVWIG